MGTYCSDAGNVAYALMGICFMAVLIGVSLVRVLRERRAPAEHGDRRVRGERRGH